MIDLLTSPEAWAALLTLTALEIVLGIDNVIFLSVIVSRIPPAQAKRARQIGLALALIFRILLLSLLVWLIGLTEPVLTVRGVALSWRDIILIGGGLFLIAQATHQIHGEVEAREAGHDSATPFTVSTGSVSPISHTSRLSSRIRNTSASARPICRACFACFGGIRDTITDRKITLSMPSTISSAVKVSSAAQASGLVRRSIMIWQASAGG